MIGRPGKKEAGTSQYMKLSSHNRLSTRRWFIDVEKKVRTAIGFLSPFRRNFLLTI